MPHLGCKVLAPSGAQPGALALHNRDFTRLAQRTIQRLDRREVDANHAGPMPGAFRPAHGRRINLETRWTRLDVRVLDRPQHEGAQLGIAGESVDHDLAKPALKVAERLVPRDPTPR